METISLTELKLIHSLNKTLNRKEGKINNLKQISSYKTIYPKQKLFLNMKKIYSFTNKKSIAINNEEIILPINRNNSFNFRYIKQKNPSKFSLYTILAIKKNKYYEEIEKINQPSFKNPKKANINIFKNKEYIKTQAEINKKHINLFESRKRPMFYLSYLKNHFNESEKMRFYSMMNKLSMIKYILEKEFENKFELIKNFLLKEGITEKKYFKEEYFNNLIKFIKNKTSIVNPTYSFKDNLINIMNNQNNFTLHNLKINLQDSINNKILRMEKMQNIINLNKTIYSYKNSQFHTLENFKLNRYDLDLKNNLNRQTDIRKRTENLQIHDIKKEPEKIMDSLGVKLNEQKNDIINKNTYYKWKNKLNNLDIGFNSDSDIFKKKHMMTEFACFIKAKDNFDLNLIKKKYNL